MKTRLILPLALFAGVGLCLGMGKAPGKGRPKPVEIDKDWILIPGTIISPEDQAAVKAVLQKYDKSLYRVETYDKGTRKKGIGSMKEMEMGHGYADNYIKFAQSTGLTTWTTKLGRGCNPTNCTTSPTPSPGPGKGHGHPDKSEELVRELKPILQKYSK